MISWESYKAYISVLLVCCLFLCYNCITLFSYISSIIAVDYEARKYGVSRMLKGDEAKEKCPNIQLAMVPEKRGKADLTNYRKASAEVMKVMSQFTSVIEKASIDEAYLDLTDRVKDYIDKMTNREIVLTDLPSTHVAGYDLSISGPDNVLCNDDDDDDDDDVIEKGHSFQVSSNFPELCQGDVDEESGSNGLLPRCDGLQSNGKYESDCNHNK